MGFENEGRSPFIFIAVLPGKKDGNISQPNVLINLSIELYLVRSLDRWVLELLN
jgi:hypothetical protein